MKRIKIKYKKLFASPWLIIWSFNNLKCIVTYAFFLSLSQELIPEFYYLPEMFVNSNNYNLGVMDDGTVVSDVELPPWAKSPEEFVRINRLVCSLSDSPSLFFPSLSLSLHIFLYLAYEIAEVLIASGSG